MAEITVTLTPADLDALADRIVQRLATHPLGPPAGQVAKTHFSEREVAEMLGVSHSLLKRWRLDGQVKPWTARRPITYRRQEIEVISEWMARK